MLKNNLCDKKSLLFIICMFGLLFSFFGVNYLHNHLPNAEIYSVKFETKGQMIDAIIYEPHNGLLKDQNSEERGLVVLIHGFAMSKEFMLSFSIELSRRGISSISISMPGHGFSDAPYYFTNHSQYAVSDAIDFMLENAIYPINQDRIGVIGHSMGAMTAIKAASRDSRITSTIALAAPNGDSDSLVNNPSYDLFYLDEVISSYVNITVPNNLFYALGTLDELVSDQDGRKIMGAATWNNPEDLVVGHIYNDNFEFGRSRLYNTYTYSDHLTEVYDTRIMQDSLDWLAKSFEIDINDFSGGITIVSWWRIIFAAIGIISSLLIFVPTTKYYYNKFFAKDSFVERKLNSGNSTLDTKENVLNSIISHTPLYKILLGYILFSGIVPGIIVKFLPLKINLKGSFVINSIMPLLLVSGIIGLLYSRHIYKNTNIYKDGNNIWALPQLKNLSDGKKSYSIFKYLIYFSLSFSITIFPLMYFWGISLFNIWLNSSRLISFFISLIMVLPFAFNYAFIFQVVLSEYIKSKSKKLINIFYLSSISSVVVGLSINIAMFLSIGYPLLGDPFLGFIVFGAIIIFMLLFFNLMIIYQMYYLDKTLYSGMLLFSIILCLILNTAFPITT